MKQVVVDTHGLVCWLCKQSIASFVDVTLDHVLPVSLGGQYELGNLRPAHSRCNSDRGNDPPPV